jgi:hypothetical protein
MGGGIDGSTPVVVTMMSEENEINRSYQEKPYPVLQPSSNDFYAVLRPTTPALPPLP